MSLFFLANSGTGEDNNQYVCQFRDEINIPAHAKVSVEKAFIPLNGLIIIDGANRRNNQFVFTVEAPPSTAGNLYLRMLCTLADGSFDAQSFANVIETAIQNQLSAYPNPFGVGTGGVFPATNPWGSAAAGEVPGQFVEPSEWICNVEYQAGPNTPGLAYYQILLTNTKTSAAARKVRITMNVSGVDSPGGVAFNGGGTGINSLAYIFQMNYLFNTQGLPIADFGKVYNDFTFPINSTAPSGFPGMILQTGTYINYNGQDFGEGTAFTNAVIIEIPELGTEFYNSFIKSKSPAVAIVPYNVKNEVDGFVLYEPRFPLQLQCGNETQILLNTLSVYIKNADGSPALCANDTERTYIVLRIETEKDIEKDIISEVKRETRKAKIKASPLYLTGGVKEFIQPGSLPQPKESASFSSYGFRI